MIKRAPLKKDPPGQCSRWRVIVYNMETKKYDWHTIRGTRADANALERKTFRGPRPADRAASASEAPRD